MDPLKKDFRNFAYVVLKHLMLSPTELQYDICLYLQHGPRRIVIEAFRGVGKSWITAAFVLWLLYCNPQLKIMVVSASKDRADAFAVFVKRLIEDMPLLHHLRPRPGQRDSSLLFDVGPATPDQSPSVKAVGVTGQLTGSRADVIVADDIETPKNSMTHLQRERLAELIKEFDAVLKPDGRVIFLGTPQTEMSLYNRLPERGYEIRIWPSRYRQGIEKQGTRLAPFIRDRLEADPSLMDACGGRGAPTDPGRFDDADLIERELSWGRSGYALQFQLDTSLSDADSHPLRLSDLMVMGLDPTKGPVDAAWGSGTDQVINDLPCVGLQGDQYNRPMFLSKDFADYTATVMYIDPAGRGKDETAFAVVKLLNGRLFLVASGGFRDGYGETTLKSLALIAKRYGVNEMVVESNFGDGMFTKLIQPVFASIHPCTITEDRAQGQKEKRIIETLEPLLNQHRLVVDEAVIRKDLDDTQDEPRYGLFYQMSRITGEKGSLANDDRLEALYGACKHFLEHMATDSQKAAERAREEALHAELSRFMDNAFGSTPAPDRWVDV